MFMGVMFFFDRSLLAMGNVRDPCMALQSRDFLLCSLAFASQIMFLAGVTLLIGVQNAFNFFFTGSRLPGSVSDPEPYPDKLNALSF